MSAPIIEDGEQITNQLKGFMAMNGLDPDTFEGTGLDVRRAIQLHWRAQAQAAGFDFSDLNDDQLTDDYHYLIFPNITLNIHASSVMLFRQRPHETDPNKMYYDVQNYALVAKGQDDPKRPPHRQFKHGEESLGEVLDQDARNLPQRAERHEFRRLQGLVDIGPGAANRHFHKTIDDYLYRESVRMID